MALLAAEGVSSGISCQDIRCGTSTGAIRTLPSTTPTAYAADGLRGPRPRIRSPTKASRQRTRHATLVCRQSLNSACSRSSAAEIHPA